MAKTLEKQIADLEAALARKRSQAREQERRDDTWRKILCGSALLTLLDGMSEARRAETLEHLHAKITRPTDRTFLGLPEEKKSRSAKATARPSSEPIRAQGPKLEPTDTRDVTASSSRAPVMPRAGPAPATPSGGLGDGCGELPFPV